MPGLLAFCTCAACLCVTKRRDSWAGVRKLQLEQHPTQGTRTCHRWAIAPQYIEQFRIAPYIHWCLLGAGGGAGGSRVLGVMDVTHACCLKVPCNQPCFAPDGEGSPPVEYDLVPCPRVPHPNWSDRLKPTSLHPNRKYQGKSPEHKHAKHTEHSHSLQWLNSTKTGLIV